MIATSGQPKLRRPVADRDANWFVLLGGQDGWLYSLWRRGAAIQVPLDPAAARRAFTRTTKLAPADRSSPLLAAE
jgi:hypothetical protein